MPHCEFSKGARSVPSFLRSSFGGWETGESRSHCCPHSYHGLVNCERWRHYLTISIPLVKMFIVNLGSLFIPNRRDQLYSDLNYSALLCSLYQCCQYGLEYRQPASPIFALPSFACQLMVPHIAVTAILLHACPSIILVVPRNTTSMICCR